MNARLRFPYDNVSGNLLWRKADLPGHEKQLSESLESFRQLGYWASAFPEGDGVTFNDTDGRKPEQQIYEDFCAAFPWLSISKSIHEYPNADLIDLEMEAGDVATHPCMVIVPLDKIHFEESFDLGPYRFVCDQQFDKDLASRLGDCEGCYLQFEASLKYTSLLRLNQRIDHNDVVILECLARAEQAMDVIRLWFSSFRRLEFTPNPAGQLKTGFYAVEIMPLGQTHLKPVNLSGLSRPLSVSNNWLGPQLHDGSFRSREYLEELLSGRSDEVALNVKGALRLCRQAFYSLGDESRFLTLVFALDGLVQPEPGWTGWTQRTYVAALASHGKLEKFRSTLLRYQALYAEVRNPLVHGGKNFYELAQDPAECCQDIYDYIGAVIDLVAEHPVKTVATLHDLARQWLRSAPFVQCYTHEIQQAQGKKIPRW